MTQTSTSRLGLFKLLLFSTVPVLVLFAIAEVVLRWTGAAETCPTLRNSRLWTCDPVMHFKMNPDLRVDGRPLNSFGFRGPELDPDAKYKIVTLGDSCTFGMVSIDPGGAREPYPRRLERFVDERDGPGLVGVLNAGVCGYNSYHGIMLLRGKLRRVPADLITVRYGWNDLLASGGLNHGDAFHEPSSAFARGVQDLLLLTAVYPYGKRLGMELKARAQQTQATPVPPMGRIPWSPNVPVSEYEHNLRRIVELARSKGAAVWLLTAPDASVTIDYRDRRILFELTAKTQLGMFRFEGINSLAELVAIHARYNQATRTVAADLGVPLVDMEEVDRTHGDEHLFSPGDVIHPTDAGHALEAEELYRQLDASGVLPRLRDSRR